MEERKQRRPAPLHWIVLGVLIVVGVVLAVVLLNGPLASSEDKAANALEQTKEQCQKWLKKEKYEKLPKLYDSVSEYPQAQAEIKRQLREHVFQIVEGLDVNRFPAVCNALDEHAVLFDVVIEGMKQGTSKLIEESYPDLMIYYQELRDAQFHLEELDACILDFFWSNLKPDAEKIYGHFDHYLPILYHCPSCKAKLEQMVYDKIAYFLEMGEYEDAYFYCGMMDYWDMEWEPSFDMLKECAYDLFEQGNYVDAKYLLQQLRDSQLPIYDEDAQLTYRLSVMYIYMETYQYAEAKAWAMSFFGETQEKLLEVLQQYTADGKAMADLETAVLKRMEMEAAGADKLEILDWELELLRSYHSSYFEDENLKQLVVDYLDAVTRQRKFLLWDQESRERYDIYYHWHLQEANRRLTLDTLHRDYGFGAENAELLALLGTGEGLKAWITAWKQIHDSLSDQLWDVMPYENQDESCLDFIGNTDYGFTLSCRVYRCDASGNLLEEVALEPVTVRPGEAYRLSLGMAVEEKDNLVIHWEITNISLNGQPIG